MMASGNVAESEDSSLAHQTLQRHNKEEQDHLEEICNAYRQYATFADCQWKEQQHRLDALPENERAFLPTSLIQNTQEGQDRAKQYREAYIRNQFCLDCILRHSNMPHSQQVSASTSSNNIASDSHMSKVSSVLKSLARDWSLEGKIERDAAYEPLLEKIQIYLPLPSAQNTSTDNSHNQRRDFTSPPNLCVPGAGVGRLALELCSLGYNVQGNEFSLFMLLASDFILNSNVCNPERPLTISPWLLETRNVHNPSDPCRNVQIPDVDPYSMLVTDQTGHTQQEFSMAAGDFLSIYSNSCQNEKWDGIVCCFFLDAVPNVIRYLQVMWDMLRDNGVLLNFGPLMYHWTGPKMRPDDESFDKYLSQHGDMDSRYLTSVDFTWQDIREILINIGFVIEFEETGIPAMYTADATSMMNTSYRCVHFVARKRLINRISDEENKDA